MNDIAIILRDISNEIGLEEDLAQACRDGSREIERLRLTDAEREAVERVIATLGSWQLQPRDAGDAATLRGLLERTE